MTGDRQRVKQEAIFLLRAAGKSWKEIQVATELSYETVRKYFRQAVEGEMPERKNAQPVNPLIQDQISFMDLLDEDSDNLPKPLLSVVRKSG